MSPPTYFVQHCPTCGRGLHIRVEYLGRRVVCQHCQGRFVASEVSPQADPLSDSVLLRRADELLKIVQDQSKVMQSPAVAPVQR